MSTNTPFRERLEQWKRGQPEFRALIDAIRDNPADLAELAKLANVVEVNPIELNSLRSLSRTANAPETRELAAQLPALEAELAKAERDLKAATDRLLDTATERDRRTAAEAERNAHDALQAARLGPIVRARLAADRVEVARAAGLLREPDAVPANVPDFAAARASARA